METHGKTILVTGANGQLGTELRTEAIKYPPLNFLFTDFRELDITDKSKVENFIRKYQPSYVVNCAAYTAVDRAEQEETQAYQLNAIAPKILAETCKAYRARLIHVSTDYVFDGKTHIPYSEISATNPTSVYGKSKLEGELQVQESGVGMIIRTSWLYSAYGNNFVKTILKHAKLKPELNVVFDQVGTPTWANDLASAIIQVIGKGEENFKPEIFHYSNEGVCSWYDFAHEIVDIAGLSCTVQPIETKDYPTPATRPPYSILNKQKIRNLYGVTTPYWRESLIKCLKQLVYDS